MRSRGERGEIRYEKKTRSLKFLFLSIHTQILIHTQGILSTNKYTPPTLPVSW